MLKVGDILIDKKDIDNKWGITSVINNEFTAINLETGSHGIFLNHESMILKHWYVNEIKEVKAYPIWW